MDVAVYENAPPEEVASQCVAVYHAAFSEPPYSETRQDADELRDRLTRYASREGFLLPVAAGADGQAVGFALGVTAHPGDWWRDQVAAVIGPDDTQRWLGQACLEIVHVAVDPACQRAGIGRRLMRAMTEQADPPTGVLSCHPAAAAAQRFYLSQGWQTITTEFTTRPGQLAYRVMGLPLASGGGAAR